MKVVRETHFNKLFTHKGLVVVSLYSQPLRRVFTLAVVLPYFQLLYFSVGCHLQLPEFRSTQRVRWTYPHAPFREIQIPNMATPEGSIYALHITVHICSNFLFVVRNNKHGNGFNMPSPCFTLSFAHSRQNILYSNLYIWNNKIYSAYLSYRHIHSGTPVL